MKITWVNHASFILECGTIKLICDPWIEGTAFDNGWALIAESKFCYESFKDITHIWFSHEHPDHFSPPNINKIPLEYRQQITVLFQETTDRKVSNYCKKAGFKKIIEMEADKYYALSDSVKCLCNPYTDGDSYLYISTEQYNILNLNDCMIETVENAEEVLKRIGKVDVLFTQFGYANKVGNIGDTSLRKKASAKKLEIIGNQYFVFKPSVIVPFASYIYFCHEDNKYMNDGINRIDTVYDYIQNKLNTKTIVLYPGDSWEIGSNHDNLASIWNYLENYEKIASEKVYYHVSKKVSLNELKNKAKSFALQLNNINKNKLKNFLSPMQIFLVDYNQSFSFDLRHGLIESDIVETKCDLSLKSDVLIYSFSHLFAGDTMQINAKFQIPAGGNYVRARQYYELASANNRGETWSTKRYLRMIYDSHRKNKKGPSN